MSDEIKNLTNEVRALRRVLSKLVELKNQKDTEGKSPQYEYEKQKTWNAARLVLDNRSGLLVAMSMHPDEQTLDSFLGLNNVKDSPERSFYENYIDPDTTVHEIRTIKK